MGILSVLGRKPAVVEEPEPVEEIAPQEVHTGPYLAVMEPDVAGISSFRLRYFSRAGQAEDFIATLRPDARRGTHAFWAMHDRPKASESVHVEALVLVRAHSDSDVVYVVSFLDIESAQSFTRFEVKRGLALENVMIYWAAFTQLREELECVSISPAAAPPLAGTEPEPVERTRAVAEAEAAAETYAERRAEVEAPIGVTPTPAAAAESAVAETAGVPAIDEPSGLSIIPEFHPETPEPESAEHDEPDAVPAELAPSIEEEFGDPADVADVAVTADDNEEVTTATVEPEPSGTSAIPEFQTANSKVADPVEEAPSPALLDPDAASLDQAYVFRHDEDTVSGVDIRDNDCYAESPDAVVAESRTQVADDTPAFVEAEESSTAAIAEISQSHVLLSEGADVGMIVERPAAPVISYAGDDENERNDPEPARLLPPEFEAPPAPDAPPPIDVKPATAAQAEATVADDTTPTRNHGSYDIQKEVKRLLKNRRFERRDSPFDGFNSPPGRF